MFSDFKMIYSLQVSLLNDLKIVFEFNRLEMLVLYKKTKGHCCYEYTTLKSN